jgi:hypothetical protein
MGLLSATILTSPPVATTVCDRDIPFGFGVPDQILHGSDVTQHRARLNLAHGGGAQNFGGFAISTRGSIAALWNSASVEIGYRRRYTRHQIASVLSTASIVVAVPKSRITSGLPYFSMRQRTPPTVGPSPSSPS